LFITANVLTVTSTSATKTMTKGLFIVASRPRRSLAGFSWFGNEPRVNIWPLRCGKIFHPSRSISETAAHSQHELNDELVDHPVYAMTIVAAIAVVRANARAIATKIILIACS
jgi:hypothetical protein